MCSSGPLMCTKLLHICVHVHPYTCADMNIFTCAYTHNLTHKCKHMLTNVHTHVTLKLFISIDILVEFPSLIISNGKRFYHCH